MVNFRQIPEFKENAQLTITEEEFRYIMDFGRIIEDLFNRNIENGNIIIKYVDDMGNELSEDQIRGMINEYNKTANLTPPSIDLISIN